MCEVGAGLGIASIAALLAGWPRSPALFPQPQSLAPWRAWYLPIDVCSTMAARVHANLSPEHSLLRCFQPWHRTGDQAHLAADKARQVLWADILQHLRHGAGAERALATDREPLALECALRSAAASGIAGATTSMQHDGMSEAAHPPLQLKVQLLRALL